MFFLYLLFIIKIFDQQKLFYLGKECSLQGKEKEWNRNGYRFKERKFCVFVKRGQDERQMCFIVELIISRYSKDIENFKKKSKNLDVNI